MTKEEINKTLEEAKKLGIDFSDIPKDAKISSVKIVDDNGEKRLTVTYTQPVSETENKR